MTIRDPKKFLAGAWDWAVLNGCFGPNGIRPTDIDLVIERNKRFLVLEGKRDRKQSTAWFIDNASGNGTKDDADTQHGAQKPVNRAPTRIDLAYRTLHRGAWPAFDTHSPSPVPEFPHLAITRATCRGSTRKARGRMKPTEGGTDG